MKKTILIAGLFALSLTVAPVSSAHHAEDESTANAQGTYYVTVGEDGVTLWEETNGHDGLQTSQTNYKAGEDGCQGEDRERRGVCYAPSDTPVEL